MFNLFNKDCPICSELRLQLEHERQINKDLTDTLSSLLKPAPIVINETVSSNEPLIAASTSKFMNWAKRKAALELADREAFETLKKSKVAAVADSEIKTESIETLEKQLNLQEIE